MPKNSKNQWREFLTTLLELDGRAQCECQTEETPSTTNKTKSAKVIKFKPKDKSQINSTP